MGTWAVVLSDGQTYGELDGCSVIYIPDTVDDINDTDDEVLMQSIPVAGLSVLTDGRMMVELINPSNGVTDYTMTFKEPESAD